MPSSPLGSTHGRTTSGVASHNRLWAAQTLERRRAWDSIITFGQHTRSNDVGRGMTSPPFECSHNRQRRAWHDITAFGQHTRSNDVGRDMKSPPLDNTHGGTTLGVTCQHRLGTTHTVERHRAWHDVTAFRQHTRSNDVRRGMPLSP